jgi:hypothetical protein
MDFIYALILISLFLAMWDLAKRWLFASSDLDDQEAE